MTLRCHLYPKCSVTVNPQSFFIHSAVRVGSFLVSEAFQNVFLYCTETYSSLREVPQFMNMFVNRDYETVVNICDLGP